MRARLSAIALATFASLTIFGSTGASAQTVQFFAVLAGGNEPAGGDGNGQGVASVMLGRPGEICFSILARLIALPNAAHIHEQVAGTDGPIVVTLTTPTAAAGLSQTYRSAGCSSGVSTAILARIRAAPSRFYVNVHNGAFPGGAIRGQLF